MTAESEARRVMEIIHTLAREADANLNIPGVGKARQAAQEARKQMYWLRVAEAQRLLSEIVNSKPVPV